MSLSPAPELPEREPEVPPDVEPESLSAPEPSVKQASLVSNEMRSLLVLLDSLPGLGAVFRKDEYPRATEILLELASMFTNNRSDAATPSDSVVTEKAIIRTASKFLQGLGDYQKEFLELLSRPGNLGLVDLSEARIRSIKLNNGWAEGEEHALERHWGFAHEVILVAGAQCDALEDRPGVLCSFMGVARQISRGIKDEGEKQYWGLHINMILGGLLKLNGFDRALKAGAFDYADHTKSRRELDAGSKRLQALTSRVLREPSYETPDHTRYLSRHDFKWLLDSNPKDPLACLTEPYRWARYLATRHLSKDLRMQLAVRALTQSQPHGNGSEASVEKQLGDTVLLTVLLVDPLIADELPTGRAVGDAQRIETAVALLDRGAPMNAGENTLQPVFDAMVTVLKKQSLAPLGNIRARTLLALRAVIQLPGLFSSSDEVLDTVKLIGAEHTLSNQGLLALGSFLRLFNARQDRTNDSFRSRREAMNIQRERFFVLDSPDELRALVRQQVVPLLEGRRGKEERTLAVAADLMEVARLSRLDRVAGSPIDALGYAREFMDMFGEQPLPATFLAYLACRKGRSINSVLSSVHRRIFAAPAQLADSYYWFSALRGDPSSIDISEKGLVKTAAHSLRLRLTDWAKARESSAAEIEQLTATFNSFHTSGIQALPSDRLKGANLSQRSRDWLAGSQAYQVNNFSQPERRLPIHSIIPAGTFLNWWTAERELMAGKLDQGETFSRKLFTQSPIHVELCLHALGVLHPENHESNTFDLPAETIKGTRKKIVLEVRRTVTPRAIREISRYAMGLAADEPKKKKDRLHDEVDVDLSGFTTRRPLPVVAARDPDLSIFSRAMPMASFQGVLGEVERAIQVGREIGPRGFLQQVRSLATELKEKFSRGVSESSTSEPKIDADAIPVAWTTLLAENLTPETAALELLEGRELLHPFVQDALRLGLASLVDEHALPEGFELLADPYSRPSDKVIVCLEFLRQVRLKLNKSGHASSYEMVTRGIENLYRVDLLHQMYRKMLPELRPESPDRGLEVFFTKGSLLDYIGHLSDTCATRCFSARTERRNMALMVLLDTKASGTSPLVAGGVGLIGCKAKGFDGGEVNCLLLRSVNPRPELLRTVSASGFYEAIVDRAAEFARAKGFHYVISPDDERTGAALSNRREIVQYQAHTYRDRETIIVKSVDAVRFNGYPRHEPKEGVSREWMCKVIRKCS